MEDVKKIVAELIKNSLNSSITIEEIEQKLESPKDKSNGDLAYPCFTLAKVLKKSPVIIAEELKENIKVSSPIIKVEAISGYLNFYIDYKDVYSSVIIDIMREKEKYGFVNLQYSPSEKKITISSTSIAISTITFLYLNGI